MQKMVKHPYSITIAAGVALAIVVTVVLRLGGSSVITAASPDGMVTIRIPQGALPDGVKSSDIAIRPLEPAAFFGKGTDAPGPAYELVPDGTVFTVPVTLTIRAAKSGVVPQLLHVSATDAVAVNPTVVRDSGAKGVEAQFALSHFSKVGIDTRQGTFHYEFASGGSAPVGGTLVYTLTVTADTHNHWFDNGVGWEPDIQRARATQGTPSHAGTGELTYRGFYYRVAPATIYTVSAFQVHGNGGDTLTPQQLNAPASEQKEYAPYHFDGHFTCARPGTTTVSVPNIDITYRMLRSGINKDDTFENNTTTLILIPDAYECTDPLKVAVIEYQGKYLPLDQLIVESEQGCDGGQAHYHAQRGWVKATDGTTMPDPGPQCGYGKVAQKPTVQVPAPAGYKPAK